jgi:hypothetical protein
MVKNEDGEVYLPGEGIEQIASWQSGEGYQVYTETSTTLGVTAPKISPGAAVELKPGWNLVPYLSAQAQAVEPALVSIEEALIVAEDGDGAQYDPSASSSPLDSLRPGQGYKVYVDRADTLRYPEVANTLEEALALEDVPIGSYVQVRGYHEAGDNGGGLFRVKNNACRTDGGTCFIFDEDLSAEQEIQTTDNLRSFTLPDSDISWLSFEIKYGPNEGQSWTARDMHGHYRKTKQIRRLDTKDGEWSGGQSIGGRQEAILGTDSPPDLKVRWKYATSNRRLERTGVTDAVNIQWWGAQPISAGYSGVDDEYTPEINWATSRAQRLLQEDSNLDTAYVDYPGIFYKLYGTMMPDNVIHRGTGAEQTFENTTVKGGVKMPPGEVLWDLQDNPRGELLEYMGRKKFAYTHGIIPENRFGFQNFSIDGNRENNNQIFENPEDYGGFSNITNKLQNGGRWAGFQTPKSGLAPGANPEWNYINGVELFADNLSIRNIGANGLGNSKSGINQNVTNLHLDRSQRNHLYYGLAGTAENIVVEGQSWATTLKLGSRKGNVSGNTKEDHPRNGESGNWMSTYTDVAVKNLNDNNFGWGNVIEFQNTNVDMQNVTIDFRGGEIDGALAFKGSSEGAKVDDVTVHIPSSGGSTLFKRSFYGPRSFQRYEITEFSNVTVHASGNFLFMPRTQSGNSSNQEFKNVTVIDEGATGGHPLQGGLETPPNLSPPGAKRLLYRNIEYNYPTTSIANVTPGGIANRLDAFPQDLFVENSTFNNTGAWSLLVKKQSNAEVQGYGERVFMSNSTFNVPTDGLNYNQFHYATHPGPNVVNNTPAGDHIVDGGPTLRLRNCTTPNGRVSDSENNTFTSGSPSEGQDYILISTSLLSRPRGINTTLTDSGPNVSSITGVEIANSDGSLRGYDEPYQHDPYLKVNLDGTIGSGESVTIDWTARVTPLSEYSTTGLFQARPVHDRTSSGAEDPLSSGNGPWTVDLRGTMATQETWTPPEYTATSGNTGVVTATVTETKHRDKQRAYTLELTEQSAGTATITVTGEIPGVGTAQTTFEVTVE